MKKALACMLLVGASAWPRSALAGPDVYGTGDGHDGALTATELGVVINHYSTLTADAAEGAPSLSVGTMSGAAGTFAPGDLVLLWEYAGLSVTPEAGDEAALSLVSEGAGRWELARIASITGSTLVLHDPLLRSYSSAFSQVVRVPELVQLTVDAAASVVAQPFDGKVGGILAVLVSGDLSVEGELSADAAGFRGGVAAADSATEACAAPDGSSPDYGARGEGIAVDDYGASGMGNVANAAGGGACRHAGGGGGASAARGGQGGFAEDNARDVGGRGGAALRAHLPQRMLMGGGAGAGHGAGSFGGGAGGGVVFVRAGDVFASGPIHADGQSASPSAAGASGGGAGGSVLVDVVGVACVAAHVRGGAGGDTGAEAGPGGGGAGGQLRIRAKTLDAQCLETDPSSGGRAGVNAANNSALAGSAGRADVLGGQGLEADSDGDGLADAYEGAVDSDNDAVPDYLDTDDDNDGLDTADEMPGSGPDARNTDGDTLPDYLDADDDGDTILTKNEVYGGNTNPVLENTDGDPRADYLDDDDDDDGILTKDELGPGGAAAPRDTDSDGMPDYRDDDDDNDGFNTWAERPLRKDNDTNLDGIADHLQAHVDGTIVVDPSDFDGDRIPDDLDPDDDNDGILDVDEDLNGNGDFRDDDWDRDGFPNYHDADDDGDGIPTKNELDASGPRDSDSDGSPDHLDTDDDNDGVLSSDEIIASGGIKDITLDTDGDGTPDARDPDDDGDGISTKQELADARTFAAADKDDDGIPNFRDTDSDGDGILDRDEPFDADDSGVPDYLERARKPVNPMDPTDAGDVADGGIDDAGTDEDDAGEPDGAGGGDNNGGSNNGPPVKERTQSDGCTVRNGDTRAPFGALLLAGLVLAFRIRRRSR